MENREIYEGPFARLILHHFESKESMVLQEEIDENVSAMTSQEFEAVDNAVREWGDTHGKTPTAYSCLVPDSVYELVLLLSNACDSLGVQHTGDLEARCIHHLVLSLALMGHQNPTLVPFLRSVLPD